MLRNILANHFTKWISICVVVFVVVWLSLSIPMVTIQATLTPILALLTPALLAVLTYLTTQANMNAQTASTAAQITAVSAAQSAEKVAIAAENLEESRKQAEVTLAETNASASSKLDAIQATASNSQRMGETIHTLVNSDRGKLLLLNSLSSRRVAQYSKDPEDEKIADEAERLYAVYKENQAIVDARPSPNATETGRVDD